MQRTRFVIGFVLVMGWGTLAQGQVTEKPVDVRTVHASPVVAPKAMDLSKADWRFAHPKPDLLASINVGNIVRSPLLAQSLQESFKLTSDADRAKIDLILKMVGTVERVQISIRETQVKNDPDLLVLVTGNLDGMVRQMLTQQAKGGTFVSREVASNAILFGKAPLIDQAARRMLGATAPAITSEMSSSDIWIAGDTGLLKGMNGVPPGLDTLKRFALGLNFRDPVELNIDLSMLNQDEAGKMMAMYHLVTAQAAQTPQAAAFVNASKVDQQGADIHFRFSAPAAMLQSQLQSAGMAAAGADPGRMAGLLGMLGMGSPVAVQPSAAPARTAAPAAPQNPGKIMIYGLDDGPREVGVPKKQE